MEECLISVVIPLYNEEKNLKVFFKRLHKTLSGLGENFEIIFVNDGSTDASEKILEEIRRDNQTVTVINLFRRMGKAAALERGFEIIRGKYVVTIDSDLEMDPEDIPDIIKKIEEGYDVVSGARTNRFDSKGKIITSRLFNMLLRYITGLTFNDYFSGLKCFRVSTINYLSLYGDLYRLAAAFAFRNGFKVIEIPVSHQQRKHGTSKYTVATRLQRAVLDLIVVLFTIIFNRKRVYYLGIGGIFSISIGVILLAVSIFVLGFGEITFEHPCGYIGIVILFLGIQILLFKTMANNFFIRHQEERAYRRRNVKSVW
jgi:glycosyltransferase involved in cell wall biosynthesis